MQKKVGITSILCRLITVRSESESGMNIQIQHPFKTNNSFNTYQPTFWQHNNFSTKSNFKPFKNIKRKIFFFRIRIRFYSTHLCMDSLTVYSWDNNEWINSCPNCRDVHNIWQSMWLITLDFGHIHQRELIKGSGGGTGTLG